MRALGLVLFLFSAAAQAADIATVLAIWTHTAGAERDVAAYRQTLPNRVGEERMIGEVQVNAQSRVFLFEVSEGSLAPLFRRFNKPGVSGVFPFANVMDIGVRVPTHTEVTVASFEAVNRYLDTADFAQRLSAIAEFCNLIYAQKPDAIAAVPEAFRDVFARHLIGMLNATSAIMGSYRVAVRERALIQLRKVSPARTAEEEDAILHFALASPRALQDKSEFVTLARAIAQALDRLNTPYATNALLRSADACDSSPMYVMTRSRESRAKYFGAWLAAARREYGNLGRAPGVYVIAESRYQYSAVPRTVLFPPRVIIPGEFPELIDIRSIPVSFLLFEGKDESFVDPIVAFILQTEQSWIASAAVTHGNSLSDVVMSEVSNAHRFMSFPKPPRDRYNAVATGFLKKLLVEAKSEPLRAMAIDRALALAVQLGPDRPSDLVSFVYDAETHVSPDYRFPCAQLLAGQTP